jgi:hypothetical protein
MIVPARPSPADALDRPMNVCDTALDITGLACAEPGQLLEVDALLGHKPDPVPPDDEDGDEDEDDDRGSSGGNIDPDDDEGDYDDDDDEDDETLWSRRHSGVGPQSDLTKVQLGLGPRTQAFRGGRRRGDIPG